MPFSAVIGGVGALGGSLLQSNAAKDAANASAAAATHAADIQQQLGNRGIDTLLSMFDQAKGFAQPIVDIGKNQLGAGMGYLGAGTDFAKVLAGAGLDTAGAGRNLTSMGTNVTNTALGNNAGLSDTLRRLLSPGSSADTLSQLPGFKFAQDWGQRSVQNLGTVNGLGANTLKAGADYATGVAQQGFTGYVQQLLAGLGMNLNQAGVGINQAQLGAGLTGTGLNAAQGANAGLIGAGANVLNSATTLTAAPTNALVSGANATGASAMTGLNTTGANVGASTIAAGNAQASGIMGSANALAGGITGVANSAILGNALSGSTTPGLYAAMPWGNANPAIMGPR